MSQAKLKLHERDFDQLTELVNGAHRWIRTKASNENCARTLIFLVNRECSRRGIAPRFRAFLPDLSNRPANRVQAIARADAPYFDLEWLSSQYPGQAVPNAWRGLLDLSNMSVEMLLNKPVAAEDDISDLLVTEESASARPIDPLTSADRVVSRKRSIPVKVRLLRLTALQQIGMRVFCTRKVRDRIRSVDERANALRDRLKDARKGTPQLTLGMVERRLQHWRAWQYAGGRSGWTAGAEVSRMMSGDSITKQGLQDAIKRLKVALNRPAKTKRRKKKTPVWVGIR